MKGTVIHGLVAGIMAAVCAIIYFNLYQDALGIDFSRVINARGILGSCVFGCMLMSLGVVLMEKAGKRRYSGIYYVILFLLSYLSILGPLSIALPIDIPRPELFPGLAIPMHFFPIMSFLSIAPFFQRMPDSEAAVASPTLNNNR